MKTKTDRVLINFKEVVALFAVSPGAVRAWVAAKRLIPVRREGKGRRMWFARGEVKALVYGMCPVCGNGFKRATIKQRFCSTLCRQRFARSKAPSIRIGS